MKTFRLIRVAAVCVLATAGSALAQSPPLTGLQLWLKADAITGLANGTKVASWPDSIGSNPAVNANPANQPTYVTSAINGKPAVLFLDASPGTWLSSVLPLNANGNDVTTLVVFRLNSSPTPLQQRDHILQPIGANGVTWLWVMPSTLPGGTNLDLTGDIGGVPTLYAHRQYVRDTWTIVSQVENNTAKTFNLYRDGVMEGGLTYATTSAASSGWVLGINKALNNQGLNGYIAEVLIYAGALSETDRRSAEQYLATKYNLPLRQTLLADTFNTANTFNLDDNLASRQTGTLGPIANIPASYSSQATLNDSLSITTNTLQLYSDDTGALNNEFYSPNLNVLNYEVNGSFRLTCDVVTTSPNLVGGQIWGGITVRGSGTLQCPGSLSGLSLLLWQLGGYQVFEGVNLLTYASTIGANTYRVCIDVVNNVASCTINGMPVAMAPGQNTYTLANSDVTTANYVSLSALSPSSAVPAYVTFDNLVVSVLPEPVLPSTTILSDNYNVPDTSDLNASLPSRQSGVVATAAYSLGNDGHGATEAIVGNQVQLNNADNTNSFVSFWPGVDFLPYERYSSFDIKCKITPSATSGDPWAAIKIREPNPSSTFVAAGDGFGILIRQDGRWSAFQGSANIFNGTVATAATYAFDLEVRNNRLKATVNGVPIFTQNMPATSSPNYVTLMSYATDLLGVGPTGVSATFDDFEFDALGAPVLAPAPILQNPAFAGGTASFQFSTVSGVVYVVEYKNDLSAPAWSFLRNVLGTGGTVTVSDSPGISHRFYRVRIVE